MAVTEFICAQCLYSGAIAPDFQFCPRCGLAIERASAAGHRTTLRFSDGSVTMGERLAFGDLCNVYDCEIARLNQRGIFKIVRSPLANKHLAREVTTLRHLRQLDTEAHFTAFLPIVTGTLLLNQSGTEAARSASILSYFDGLAPSALYSLAEVRTAYPTGIDARDMAWMWRRVLSILGFIHKQNLAHGAITPDHVLIEPNEHKLVLVGWSAAAAFGMLPHLSPMRWREWTTTEDGSELRPCCAASDLASAARSMSYILGEDIEPAVTRHLQRAGESSDAWRLLADFDAMIEVLWGPRRFRAFSMPARQ